MGQYYNILTYKDRKYTVYDRSIKTNQASKPEYMLAKLTEHSWIGNYTMESFSNIIYKNPMKVAWVGDYVNQIDIKDIHNPNLSLKQAYKLHEIAWNRKEKSLILKQFETSKMLLINWTKQEYLNMQEYIETNSIKEWCMHPLSLLTAIGNEYGGGDYYGINKEQVGIWAFDEISFDDNNLKTTLALKGFTKRDCNFIDPWQETML
ncbi:MAG: hypothetical protein IJ837_03540 [Clostridia bacterium]|nr:hypothetical protein [Clostridia bacterium]